VGFAGSADPPPDCSGAAPHCCTLHRSSDCPGRTTSTGTPPRCTGRRQTAGNRGAGPGLQSLDTDAETGDDPAARSVSSRLTRATEVLPQTCTVSRVLIGFPDSPRTHPRTPPPVARHARDDDDDACLKRFARPTARITRLSTAAHARLDSLRQRLGEGLAPPRRPGRALRQRTAPPGLVHARGGGGPRRRADRGSPAAGRQRVSVPTPGRLCARGGLPVGWGKRTPLFGWSAREGPFL